MSASSKRKIVFLLGSGISIPAGMPKLDKITERVLSGEGIYYHEGDFSSNVRPYVEPAKKRLEEEQKENVRRIVRFLHRLKVEIYYYYERHKFKLDTNYEDLYYMALQIFDSQIGNYDNPAVQALVDKIFPEIKSLLEKNNFRHEWTLSELAEIATQYIEYVVSDELNNKQLQPLDYLGCIKEACEDDDFSNVDIFTLNHDTVLETYFKRDGIQFTDGFFKPDGEKHRYWEPSLFNCESFKVRLFKLHGSINWFRFEPEGAKDRSDELIGIPSGMRNYRIEDSKGRILDAIDKRPILLIGVYNKMLEYTSGIFEELHYQFYRSLRQVKQLVICGYGFGDRGINNKIIEWICSSHNHRIILVNPEPEIVRNKAGGSIRKEWEKWIGENKLKLIPKEIEKTSWKEIRGSLFKTYG